MLITPSCWLLYLLLLMFWNSVCPKHQCLFPCVVHIFYGFQTPFYFIYNTHSFGEDCYFAVPLYYTVACNSIFISRQKDMDINPIICLPRSHLIRGKTTNKINWEPWYITQTTSSGTLPCLMWCKATGHLEQMGRWALLRKDTPILSVYLNPRSSVILMAFMFSLWP